MRDESRSLLSDLSSFFYVRWNVLGYGVLCTLIPFFIHHSFLYGGRLFIKRLQFDLLGLLALI